jgi:hypothetical protein
VARVVPGPGGGFDGEDGSSVIPGVDGVEEVVVVGGSVRDSAVY